MKRKVHLSAEELHMLRDFHHIIVNASCANGDDCVRAVLWLCNMRGTQDIAINLLQCSHI